MFPLAFDAYDGRRNNPTISLTNVSQDLKANLPISSLFILFIIVGGNYISQLFPCGLQTFLERNMFAKHVLGFFTLLLFVELSNASGDDDGVGWKTVIVRSVLLYIWFVFTTTMEPSVFFVLLGALTALYVMRLYINQLDTKANPEDIKTVAKLRVVESWLYYSCIVITMFGVIAYYGRKKGELGNKFNIARFFIGNVSCKGTHPSADVWKNFLMAFPKN
jgi:hypothetical protein